MLVPGSVDISDLFLIFEISFDADNLSGIFCYVAEPSDDSVMEIISSGAEDDYAPWKSDLSAEDAGDSRTTKVLRP